MATKKRSYGDACGIARALDTVGERWALLVVRELLFGPKRFTDLRAGLPHVSPDVLAQRLRELEDTGIVQRRALGPPAPAHVYELTDRGRELEPILIELGRWGRNEPFPPGEAEMSADSMALALRTSFDPKAADRLAASYELRLGGQPFRLEVADGGLELARGNAGRPDAVIDTDVSTLAEVLWHGRSLTDALSSGDMEIEGSRREVNRLLRLFAVA